MTSLDKAFKKIHHSTPLTPFLKKESTDMNSTHFATEDAEAYLRLKYAEDCMNKGQQCSQVADGRTNVPLQNRDALIAAINAAINDTKFVSISSDCLVSTSKTAFISLHYSSGAKGNFNWYSFASSSAEAKRIFLDLLQQYECKERTLTMHWVWGQAGEYTTVTEVFDKEVTAVLYPQVPDFDTFSDRFMASNSNVLILQGPPGTGKTTFIKHLLEKMGKEAFVTYDSSILSTDRPFATFIDDYAAGAFVIEDADLILASRQDGNSMVSRFLNIGDGLVSLKNKKLIFSTNLPNLNDVDEALTRPGRCFGVYNFRNLTLEEAKAVAAERNLEFQPNPTKRDYSLAEVFNSPVIVPQRTFGFS